MYVVDAEGNIVRTVATGRHMRKDVRNPDGVFHWDGRLDNGRVAPDGTYYFRVALIHQNRTIDLTGVPVKVKTVPPHPVVMSVSPSVIPTPAGGTSVTIRYAGNENRGGTILLYRTDLPGGPRLVKTFLTPWVGSHRGVGRDDPRATRAARALPGGARGERRGLRPRPLARRGSPPTPAVIEPRRRDCPRTVCRHDGLPQAPGQLARGLPGRRRGLEVHRGAAAAGLHAVHRAGRLRRGRAARQRGDPDQHPGPLRDDRVVPALLLLGRRRGPARRAGAARGRLPAPDHHDRVALARRGGGPALEAGPRLPRPDDLPDRGAGAVVVHQPRAGLRAAAGRGAAANLRHRLADQRGPDDRRLAGARGRPRPGRPRAAAGQLRRLDGRAARACGGRCATAC